MKVVLSSKMPTNSFTSLKMTTKYIKMGRGAQKDRLRPQYRLCRTHQEKRRVQQMLLDWVQQTEGTFVKESPTDKRVLVVVTDQKKLLQKAAQTLREPRKRVVSRAILSALVVSSAGRRSVKKQGNAVLLNLDHPLKESDLRFDLENVKDRPVIKNEVLRDAFYQNAVTKSIVPASVENGSSYRTSSPDQSIPPETCQ
jgi:hypothetical protein